MDKHSLAKLKTLVEKKIAPVIAKIESNVEYHQERLLDAFQAAEVSDFHLHASTGYGYNDLGRSTYERIIASLFGAEKALVKPSITSGTHAIACCLYGILRPGDQLIYLTGQPYDTLLPITEKDGAAGSLADFGIDCVSIPLYNNWIDEKSLRQIISPQTKMIAIQRSRGYETRPSFTVVQIQEMIKLIRTLRDDIVIFVDNCYGEFVEDIEPTHVGADLIAGSLIKNLGGGLAKSGGYIIGKNNLVQLAASRLVAPGLGVEGGATHGYLRDFFQGLFLAPHVVGEALKGAVFTASLLAMLNYNTSPKWNEQRTDIIQQVELNNSEELINFCQGIQSASPIDSHVRLTPANMPGYHDDVVMAAGTFVQGSSIELSADGPLRSPYAAYLQGGLTYAHVKIAIMRAIKNAKLMSRKIIK